MVRVFCDAVASIASTTRRSRRPRAGTADRRRIASPSGFKPRTEAKPATRAVAGRATVDGRHTRPSARVDRDARTAPTATRARSPSFARRRRLGRAESGASARADRRHSRGAPFLDCFSRSRAPTRIERDARILPPPSAHRLTSRHPRINQQHRLRSSGEAMTPPGATRTRSSSSSSSGGSGRRHHRVVIVVDRFGFGRRASKYLQAGSSSDSSDDGQRRALGEGEAVHRGARHHRRDAQQDQDQRLDRRCCRRCSTC